MNKCTKKTWDCQVKKNKMNLEKFIGRNKESLGVLNLFISENKDNIRRLVTGHAMICWLAEIEAEGGEKIDIHTFDYEHYKYQGIRVLYDPYHPDDKISFLMKDTFVKFDVPCICGIYNDEPHDLRLK